MNREASQNQGDTLAGIHPGRLFLGSCMSLVSTAVVFGVVTSLMGDLKAEFGLTNTEAGWIGGATIWGFTISIFIFGPLCNVIGMGRLLRFSMICHLAGPLLMIFAGPPDSMLRPTGLRSTGVWASVRVRTVLITP